MVEFGLVIGLFMFVIGHLAGNLQIFLVEHMDDVLPVALATRDRSIWNRSARCASPSASSR